MTHPTKPNYHITQMNEFDPRTTSELAAQGFSGIRTNDLASRFEIWIVGRMDRAVSYQRFWDEPYALETAYCEAFGLKEVSLEGAVKEAIREIEGRKRGIEEMQKTDAGKRLLDQYWKTRN